MDLRKLDASNAVLLIRQLRKIYLTWNHLKTSQRAQCAAEVATLEVGQAGNGRDVGLSNDRATVAQAAEMFSVSTASVNRAKHVKDHTHPEALAAFREAMKHQGQRTDLSDNVREVDAVDSCGNSRAYSIDRVKRECEPEVVAAVMAGESALAISRPPA